MVVRTKKKLNKNKVNAVAAISNIVGILLILFVIACLLPVFVPKLMGREVFTVVSGSMEPEVPVGSLVIIKKADPLKIQAGDIIAFRKNGTVVTHRVVENQSEARQFITKGDANDMEDLEPVSYTGLVGLTGRKTFSVRLDRIWRFIADPCRETEELNLCVMLIS